MPRCNPSRRPRLVVRPIALLVALMLAVVAPALGVTASAARAQPATPVDPLRAALDAAVAYLVTQQDGQGAFAGPAGAPDPGTTTDAVFALRAAGFRGVAVDPAIAKALAYLETAGPGYAAIGPGQAAKLALAAVAGRRDPSSFAGMDLLAAATSAPATPAATPTVPGISGSGLFDHALVLLALAAANRPVPPAAIDVLRSTQLGDGSWGYAGATEPGSGDSNTTALVVQALVATDHGADPMVEVALGYLRSVETAAGQFAYQPTAPLVADANSTALAVQAIIAVGPNPSISEWRNAASGLAAFQNASGAFRYQDGAPGDNLLATVQAIPALAGIPLPVAVACPVAAPTPAVNATPVIALPAPSRGRPPCVAIEPAA